MALVAYDVSDEEMSDGEDENIKTNVKTNKIDIKIDKKVRNESSKPINVGLKGVGLDISWSLLDKHRIQPVRIPIPSVVDDKEEKVKPKPTPLKRGAGLFAILPKPKSEMVSNTVKTTLKPTSVMRPKAVVKPKPKAKPKIQKESDSESDTEDGSSFFFSPDTDVPVDPTTAKKIAQELLQIEEKVVKSMDKKEEEEIPEEVTVTVPTVERNDSMEINEEALAKLCGTKDRRTAAPDGLIDVDGNDLVGDSKLWLVKELSKEVNTAKQKYQGTLLSKRKHQITYLAAHAKANELDLQNQWANNRQSRKQTQAKYGF